MFGTTRRQFLQTSAAGAVVLATPFGTVHAANKGGVMRMGKAHGQTVDSLDPGTHENGFTIAMTHGYNGYMTEVGADGSLVGQLRRAGSLRPTSRPGPSSCARGVTYHNGREVTAEDVVASINHHRGEESNLRRQAHRGPDRRHQGRRHAHRGLQPRGRQRRLPFILSDYHLPILPSEGGKADWQSGIGGGRLQDQELRPGGADRPRAVRGLLDSGRGHFDEIQMITIVDPTARTNAIITGQVDAIDRVDLKTVHLLKRRAGLNVHSIAGTQHYSFPMRTNVAPFDDNNVRMAIKHAINREEMVEKILQGFGVVGNDHPIGPGQRFFATDLEQRTYDPDKAKHYLKQAGMTRSRWISASRTRPSRGRSTRERSSRRARSRPGSP